MQAEDFLLELFKEENTHARHTEIQRLEVTKFILGAVGVTIAFMATLKFSIYCLPFGLVIVALGFVGRKIAEVYVKRFDDHRNRGRAYRDEIDRLAVPSGLAAPIRKRHPIKTLPGNRVRDFWLRINSGVIALGLICIISNCVVVIARAHSDPSPTCFFEKIVRQFST